MNLYYPSWKVLKFGLPVLLFLASCTSVTQEEINQAVRVWNPRKPLYCKNTLIQILDDTVRVDGDIPPYQRYISKNLWSKLQHEEKYHVELCWTNEWMEWEPSQATVKSKFGGKESNYYQDENWNFYKQ